MNEIILKEENMIYEIRGKQVMLDSDVSNTCYIFDYKHKNIISKNLKYKRVAFLSEEEINNCIAESKKNYNSK